MIVFHRASTNKFYGYPWGVQVNLDTPVNLDTTVRLKLKLYVVNSQNGGACLRTPYHASLAHLPSPVCSRDDIADRPRRPGRSLSGNLGGSRRDRLAPDAVIDVRSPAFGCAPLQLYVRAMQTGPLNSDTLWKSGTSCSSCCAATRGRGPTRLGDFPEKEVPWAVPARENLRRHGCRAGPVRREAIFSCFSVSKFT